MPFKPYSRLLGASRYCWFFLTILLALAAVLPTKQNAQPKDRQSQAPGLHTEQTKKEHRNAVPGEILVRFRSESEGKRLGKQLLRTKTGRQIPLSIEAISPALEIV